MAKYWELVALAFLTLAVYGNILSAGFVTDDRLQILRNQRIRSFATLPQLLTSGSEGFMGNTSNYYRPTQGVAYLLLYRLRGYDAFSFHLLLVALHAVTTILVYLLVRRFTSATVALAAGALFAVHPIHTEAVDWIAAFPDAFMTLTVVLGVLLFVRQGGAPRGIQIAGQLGLYLLAVFSKEPGTMLLPLYVGFEWICLRRTVRDLTKNAVLYAGMAAVALFYLVARYHALGGFAPVNHVLSQGEFLLSVVTVAAHYLANLAVPIGLNYFHVFEPTRSIGLVFLLSLFAILTTAAAFVSCYRRPGTGPQIAPPTQAAFGLLWIALTLAPALSLTHVGENVFAERYLYLPSVGFVWIAALAWEWLAQRERGLAYTVGAAVLALFALMTFARNQDWHDDLRLMQVTARQSPQSATIRDNLANDYAEAGRLDEALDEERIAERLSPHFWHYHLNVGNLLISRDPHGAIQECEQVLQLVPNEPDANYCIGLAWKNAGDSQRAAAALERTLASAPEYYLAMLALSRLDWESGRVEDAIGLLQRAAKARPAEPEPAIRLAVLYSDNGRYQEAAQLAQLGLSLSPDPDLAYFAHYVLGTAYRQTGSLAEAANEFRKAYQAHPDRPAAKEEYDKLMAQLGGR